MRIKVLLSICAVALMVSSAEAATVSFRSGNGSEWGADSIVRFKPYQNTGVPNDPTALDFLDVRTTDTFLPKSHEAVIAPADTNGWDPAVDVGDAAALPVFNFVSAHVYGVGSSSLFGIPIEVNHGGAYSGATLNFSYVVDNHLGFDGEAVIEGLYLGKPGDEHALDNTANYTPYDPADPDTTRFASGTISMDVTAAAPSDGTYWLYMNVTDRGVPAAGILFSGSIVTHNPEPSTIFIWSLLGMTGFGIARWRKQKQA